MSPRKATELTDLVKKLRAIRRQHEQALAEIEQTFRSLGIEHLLVDGGSKRKRGAAAASPVKKAPAKKRGKAKRGTGKVGRPPGKAKAAAKPVGRPKGKKPGPKPGKGKASKATKAAPRSRAKYSQTGDEFILAFLAKKGNATTTEIRQHWQKAGRKGKAENNLTGLVKSGKLLRNPTPGEAGSTYSIPSANTSAPSW
jgi:hypothetical protein